MFAGICCMCGGGWGYRRHRREEEGGGRVVMRRCCVVVNIRGEDGFVFGWGVGEGAPSMPGGGGHR